MATHRAEDASPAFDGTDLDAPEAPDLEGVARDASTITDVLEAFESSGYGSQFIVREQGVLECTICRERSSATDVECRELRRLEGASDPDDMLAVAALVCPRCAARGTVVLGYGPAASEDDAEVLAVLDAPAPSPAHVEQPQDR
jgi:hypothetical protein